jgi:hypothetical protein
MKIVCSVPLFETRIKAKFTASTVTVEEEEENMWL